MEIPTTNFNSPDAPQQFTRSLKESGFAALSNHPIDMRIVEEVYLEWKTFFQSDKKHNYPFDLEKQDGFFPFGIEHAKDYHHKDLKEFYHIYPWGRFPKELSKKTKLLYHNLCEFAETLLKMVELNTPESIQKNLLKTIDLLGRETTNKGFNIEIYDDGSVEKKYLIK